MCKSVTEAVGCFVLTLLASSSVIAASSALPTNLADTLDLYLSAESSYREADLITESQVREFQIYLRRTRGTSLATHPMWAKKALADHEPLARLFYNGGAAVIRATVKKTGGYDELVPLARNPRSRGIFEDAIKENEPELLMQAVEANRKKQVSEAKSNGKSEQQMRTTKELRIFTARDYVAAVTEAAGPKVTGPEADASAGSRALAPEKLPEKQ